MIPFLGNFRKDISNFLREEMGQCLPEMGWKWAAMGEGYFWGSGDGIPGD